MSTASSGYIIVEVISARRISAPPNTDYEYQASVQAGDQSFTTQPARISANSFAGQTLTWRERIVIRLNSSYDARRGLVILVSSTCGKVQFGAASCAHPREWLQLSKPRGEVQVIFSQQWDTKNLLLDHQGAGSAGSHGLGVGMPNSLLSLGGRQRPQSAGTSRPLGSGSSFGGVGKASSHTKGSASYTTDSYSMSPQQRPSLPPAPSSARPGASTRPSTAAAPSALRNSRSSGNGGIERSSTILTPCTVHVLSVELCNLAITLEAKNSCLFFVILFAHQEHLTTARSLPFASRSGYSGCWADRILEYDVPVAQVVDRAIARVQLWEGQNKFDGRMLTETTVSLRRASELPEIISTTAKLPEYPGASIIVTAQGISQQPLREGKNGRPMSAFTRKGKPNELSPKEASVLGGNTSVTFHPDVRTPQKRGVMTGPSSVNSHLEDQSSTALPHQKMGYDEEEGDDGIIDDSGSSMDEAEDNTEFAAEGKPQTAAAKMAEEAQIQRTLEAVGQALSTSLETALAPVMARISMLETRIHRSEESLMALVKQQHHQQREQQNYILRPTTADGGLSTSGTEEAADSRGTHRSGSATGGGGRASRPGSAASQGTQDSQGSPSNVNPHNKLCVTHDELAQRFSEYDMFETGYLSKAQLIHFYRSSYSFASDESEDEIEEKLRRQVGSGLEEDRVAFDDFCRVALKLAKA